MATPPDFTTGQVLTAAQMNAVGMWKMTPTSVVNGTIQTNGDVTFTGQSTVSLNGVFTTDYINYLVTFNELTIAVGAQDLSLRMRNAGADATGATDYAWSYDQYTSLNVNALANSSGDSSGRVIRINAGGVSNSRLMFFQPKVAQRTLIINDSLYWPFDTDLRRYTGSIAHELANSYDGFSIIIGGSTISGSVSVFGYN